MKALNLFMLTRVTDSKLLSRYHARLSENSHIKWTNSQEAESLCLLVRELLRSQTESAPVSLENLDGFYFSYTIRHISKEFDLLKLAKNGDAILNIELKSEDIGEDRIRTQLLQNRYYLGHISQKIYSFTYVSSTNTLYCLNNHDYLVVSDMSQLIRVLNEPVFREYIEDRIEDFFDVAGYIISPINTPDRFLRGEYFLTNQQWDFRKQILEEIRIGRSPYITGISGGPGTGKTLLLYDLAVTLSKKKTVCILHCGPLYEGHRLISQRLKNVSIISPDDPAYIKKMIDEHDYFMIDDTGRLPSKLFKQIMEQISSRGSTCIFCYDSYRFQFGTADITRLKRLISTYADKTREISGNIRINRSLTSFWYILYNRNNTPADYAFPGVEICYARTMKDMRRLLSYYKQKHYQIIDNDEEPIIGREFDKVCMIMDDSFFYNKDGTLSYGKDKEANRAALTFLYDGITRARDELCLIIIKNKPLFDNILESMQRK